MTLYNISHYIRSKFSKMASTLNLTVTILLTHVKNNRLPIYNKDKYLITFLLVNNYLFNLY